MAKLKEYSNPRGDANKANAALLEKFRNASATTDLSVKLAAHAEVARARDARHAAREAEKLAERQRVADEAAAVIAEEMRHQAEEAARIETSQSARDRRIALVLSDEAARQSARDQRYAKRKAAQKAA